MKAEAANSISDNGAAAIDGVNICSNLREDEGTTGLDARHGHDYRKLL